MNQFCIYLNHGRAYPEEELDDWGADGPILGPFTGMHLTYMSTVRFFNSDGASRNDEYEASIVGDLFFYDGMYYGDWGVITFDPNSDNEYRKLELPDESKFDPETPEYVVQRAKHRLVPNR